MCGYGNREINLSQYQSVPTIKDNLCHLNSSVSVLDEEMLCSKVGPLFMCACK